MSIALLRIPRRLVKPSACLFHSTRHVRSDQQRPKEYELRVGYAIATLQDDLPLFFANGLTEPEIYSTDIVLSDPHYTKLSIHSRTAYLTISQMLKWSTNLYYDDIQVQVTKMRVLGDDEDLHDDDDDDSMSMSSIQETESDMKERGIVKRLQVNWKMQGIKHPSPLLLQPVERVRHIEGVFIYKFDHLGFIREHRIQRIVPPPSRRVLLLHSLSVRLRALFWEKRSPVLNPGF
ncbi:hypothetical protein INT47_004907 [Mucor saturninus]|uniref:Uncharacterized protein n=1 Tax=Mucor saturninus TaxID=64648 RepID=A0A8H7R3W3_9FUNG|nr:hypothetical protein INT47_004907 [Mucor saturninus]